MKMSELSDDALMASLRDICTGARQLDVRFIAHLIEVEDRRLHLTAACSSLFDFCVRRLQMSEGAAFRRINAARLLRRFPRLAAHIEDGRVHLSTLVLLRDHLSESNVDELVAAASGKTKREVEELLARRAPRPDVPAKIRKLPAPSVASTVEPGASLFDRAASAAAPPRPAARIEPLSAARYKVQLTVHRAARQARTREGSHAAPQSERRPGGDRRAGAGRAGCEAREGEAREDEPSAPHRTGRDEEEPRARCRSP